MRVIRLNRSGDINITRVLDNEQIKALWGDPLLRHSNILDGLFHEQVIVCESDSDCRFYSAMTHVHFKSLGESARAPDIMFVHGGGKDRVPVVLKALHQVAVPVKVVLDFDALREKHLLQSLLGVLGQNWDAYRSIWVTVEKAISGKKPELSVSFWEG